MEFVIRKAQMNDAAGIATILQNMNWWDHIRETPVERTVQIIMGHVRLCNADHSHTIYVAEAAGELIGYAAVHWLPYLFLTGPEGYISELFVHEKGRRQGVGTSLLEVIKKEARERGCSRLALVNNRGRDSYKWRFYEKSGWTERKEMANFILKLK